eukprot:CAMPEP_0178980688 /NCGR_PEP_ID=MMETSP0789-20121207/26641_1 /TAXON_ID=3005 /ORGANISM="Rhizosolenia setigera, Strain CCMP 1694" /LENGTH=243 /DNA_ID=CAMNT_0020671141 /DNA_START=79 /DNA_END=810 /DNA_ORIENTATION=-
MDVQGADIAAFDLMSWYLEIPPVSRAYLTCAFLTTAACAVDIISPFTLYFNFDLIFFQGQVWRLITTYLFFGTFSIDFLFHMYFLVRYCRLLEEGEFRGKTADFVMFLFFGISVMTFMAPFASVHFLGSSLTFMMIYVWGRRNSDLRMGFLGVLNFTAPYLPWVMLGFSLVLGNPVMMDIIGVIVGHLYYFLAYIYPVVADIRGWRVKKILEPPMILHWICGTDLPQNENIVVDQDEVHLHQD